MISAGSLDRRLDIQQLVLGRDAMGGNVETYNTQFSRVPCMIKPFSGREKYKVESAREITYKQYKFVIRYLSGLTEKHRVFFEGEFFDILSIAEISRREGLEILAQVAK